MPLRIPTLKGVGQQIPSTGSGDLARLDQFELVRRLGGGGMAEVFLARKHSDGRMVVIKRLRRNLMDSRNVLGMFLDEIQVTARLDHPHLVKLAEPGYSLAEWFLVLEPIAGLPLSRLLRRLTEFTYGSTPLTPGAVALLGAQVASGLHHAHSLRDEGGNPMNIVHRDVSPQNIMVTFAGQAKVIDFGVAKLTGSAGHTRPGDVKGKFGYMAPEQARPTTAPITPRTDVFALGVVLWEMLAGRRLFLRKSPADSLRALFDEPVQHPSELRRVGPFLDGIVMRALSPDPEQRFADAAQMADALFGIVGKDRALVEAELGEKLALVRQASPDDFAAALMEGAGVATEADSHPVSTESGSTVRRRQPTPDVPATPAPRPEPAPGLLASSQSRRRAKRSVSRTPARDLRHRVWRSLSRPLVNLGLAMLLVMDIGLRFLGHGPPAPTISLVPGPRAPTVAPPTRSPIIEPLPHQARAPVPANDNGRAPVPANDTGAPPVDTTVVAASRQTRTRGGVAPTGRPRRRLISQAHPQHAVRSHGAPSVVRPPASSRRTHPRREH